MTRFTLGVVVLAVFTIDARAGLYYSGESFAELPSQWRGFLLDQRLLRNIAIKPTDKQAASPARLRYEDARKSLEKTASERKLTADELADLGALHIRLGDVARAVDVLRKAQREHETHFRIAANLGTAWQLQGDLEQAVACLQQAVRLAPGKLQKAEEYQLKLVRLRQREKPGTLELDNLFDLRFVGDSGKYEAGKLGDAERKKLPSEAVTIVQQLALWLPADGRLLWQLAELANAHGDVKTAAAIMDGCVNEFVLRSAELREHRQLTRVAVDDLAKKAAAGAKAEHDGHVGGLKPRSLRPLLSKLEQTTLAAIRADGVNTLPWFVLADTTLDAKFRPTFPKYLRDLDGKQVTLSGYMQAVGDDLEPTTFMLIEYPVGCWYCEMPEINSIIFVELPAGKTTNLTRELITVEGTLTLNHNDPENFLYTIDKAKVKSE